MNNEHPPSFPLCDHHPRLLAFKLTKKRIVYDDLEDEFHLSSCQVDLRKQSAHIQSNVTSTPVIATMSDFNYGGTDEESAEIKKLNAEVVSIHLVRAFSYQYADAN